MARKFILTDIVDPVKAPFSKRSLEHVNTAFDDLSEQIIKTIYKGYTTNDILVLEGCVVTANIPGTSSITAGRIYYNGRIYNVDANASISTPANTLVWDIVETYISGDPATFSDGGSYNFHEIAKATVINGVSGSGLANYNAATVKYLQKHESLSGNQANITRFGNQVNISIGILCGQLNNGDTVYTIPAEYRTTSNLSLVANAGTYESGGGVSQIAGNVPVSINTATGVITVSLDMEGTDDVLFVNFGYLII